MDYALIVGDGTTFVPVALAVDQTAWTTGQVPNLS